MIVIPFKDDKLSIYPGSTLANIDPRIRVQLEKKRPKWEKADP